MMLGNLLKKAELKDLGVHDPFDIHRKTPLAAHLDEWEASLQANGRDEEYIALKLHRVRETFDQCKFVMPDDLAAAKVETFLGNLRDKDKRSVQTVNDWLQAYRQFAGWMVDHERLARDPFAALKKSNPEKDRKHIRRALAFDELETLVQSTRTRPTVFRRLAGADRSMIYVVGAYTGLRAGELAELCPENFGEQGGTYGVGRSGGDTKNGKVAFQVLPPDVADELWQYIAGKAVGTPIWPGTWHDRGADMIRSDAGHAGLTLDVQTPTGVHVLDFHSLRGTLGVMLETANIPLKTRQTILRHSDPRLNLNRYTNLTAEATTEAMNALPSVFADTIPLTRPLTRVPCKRLEPSRTIEDGTEGEPGTEAGIEEDPKSLEMKGIESDLEPSETIENGEGGIRTRGAILLARRFSKAVLSTTQPPLRHANLTIPTARGQGTRVTPRDPRAGASGTALTFPRNCRP